MGEQGRDGPRTRFFCHGQKRDYLSRASSQQCARGATKKGINNVLLYFTYLLRSPHGWISTKFCIAVEVLDIITCDQFFGDRLSDVDSVIVENGPLQFTKPVAVDTLLTQVCS